MGVKDTVILLGLAGLILVLLPFSSANAQICPGGFCAIVPDDPCFGPIKPPECFDPPPVEDPEPVVLVPGIIVSLNPQITFFDRDSGGTWGYAPGAENVYRGLIERLEQAGLDVTVAHYDWRKPATENRSYLTDAIADAKTNSPNGKVDIVSHSFGGLVARDYIQSNSYQDDVDQLITLGTPHKGAADAYVALGGGISGLIVFHSSSLRSDED